jgi:hypothetical protein
VQNRCDIERFSSVLPERSSANQWFLAPSCLPESQLLVILTDAERRKLATLGKALGRKGSAAVVSIAAPETILRWYRELVAKKYELIMPAETTNGVGKVDRRERLGGLLSFYYRKAALRFIAIRPERTRSSFGTGQGRTWPAAVDRQNAQVRDSAKTSLSVCAQGAAPLEGAVGDGELTARC